MTEKRETAEERDQREAEIIAGELVVSLPSGRSVTIRELRWRQSRQFGAKIQPLVDAVARHSSGGSLDVEAYFSLPEQFPEVLDELLKATTGLSDEDLDGLSDMDGRTLAAGFLSLHTPFFVPRVGRAVRAAERRMGAAASPDASSTQGGPESYSQDSSGTTTTP